MQGIRLARPAGDLVFDETLEHFKFIRIKPCEAANVAPVDLDEIGPAVKGPEHDVIALRACVARHLPCPRFFQVP